jgi:fructokinase
MFDIVAVGELLIDFTPQSDGSFIPNPGGAPCNFLAMAQKLGSKTAFIGKVGQDAFGNQLKETIQQSGIDTSGLVQDERYMTTLAFVHLTQSGERSFSFYRKSCADVMLTREDINLNVIDAAGTFHFGSLSLTDEPIRTTVMGLLDYVKSKNKLITYDPNYRPALWPSQAEAVSYMVKGAAYADIVKVSEEELLLLTGTEDYTEGCRRLHEMGAKCVTVTLGEQGAFFSYEGGRGMVPARRTKVVDTTGAGDAFFGTFVHQLIHCGQPIERIKMDAMKDYVQKANLAASLCIEGYGGIPAMPDKKTLENEMIKSQ